MFEIEFVTTCDPGSFADFQWFTAVVNEPAIWFDKLLHTKWRSDRSNGIGSVVRAI